MSDNQQELPEFFNVKLQKHGDDWHVVSIHDHKYPQGKKAKQPTWSTVRKNLEKLGYTMGHEPPVQPPGQRLIEMVTPKPPSLYDAIVSDEFDVDSDVAENSDDSMVRDITRQKFGKL